MIHGLLVTSSSATRPLTLAEPETSGFVVLGIDGLGPPKTTLNMTQNAAMSGSKFTSARTPSRNISLALQFQAYPDIQTTRRLCYALFPLESKIRLDFITRQKDSMGVEFDEVYYIEGYVESNEPSIFAQNQGATISIVCPDPYFKSSTTATVFGDVELTASLFQFPFSNAINTQSIIFGESMLQSIDFPIECLSTVAVSPKLILSAEGGDVVDPRIYFRRENESTVNDYLGFIFTTELPKLVDGDHLVITTEPQNKTVRRYVAADDEYLNYLGAVTMDSSWPIFHPGINLISYEATSGGANIRLSYEYDLKYIGI